MNRTLALIICVALSLLSAACERDVSANPREEAPPPARVEKELDASLVQVDHPEQFPLAVAARYDAAPSLNVTGSVAPDVSRNVPVISLASGRVVAIHARLGDEVKKGDLLMEVRSQDISGAFAEYRKAVVAEKLARVQLERARTLFEKGAIAKKDVEVAQSTEDSAVVDVQTTTEHLRVLGSDPEHPTGVVEIFAPVSGVITDQQVTAAAGVQGLSSTNPFIISDLSHVWVMCDVYENDLPLVHVGEYADVRLNAYPDKVFKGRIGNIGPIMDPAIRTAKVRLEMANPGVMRIGMFVTATFHGQTREVHAMVPASAILHLHDREWVYTPAGNGRFRRLEVTAGEMLPGNMQEIKSGLDPGRQVVTNALVLENTVDQ